MKFRTLYRDDYAKPPLDCSQEPGADQSFRDECDINTIVRRYGIGVNAWVSPLNDEVSDAFVDLTEAPADYLEAQNKLLVARRAFDQLPSRLRERFRNSPFEMLAYVTNPDNRAEALELGLLNKPAPPAPDSGGDKPAVQARNRSTMPHNRQTAPSRYRGGLLVPFLVPTAFQAVHTKLRPLGAIMDT